jgi:aspartyl protease family protein
LIKAWQPSGALQRSPDDATASCGYSPPGTTGRPGGDPHDALWHHQRGSFILDSGASFVSLKNTFAQKAKVQVDPNSNIRLHTANGISTGKRGRAKTIQLRSLQAKDVPIIVQDDAKGTYGDGVDGLLGVSFLSRFKLTVDARTVRISARK